MAVNYHPADYEAIHSTFEDNFVYANDANYVSSLNSIHDPVLRLAWIPGSWDILAGQFFQNWDPARHVKNFGQCVFEPWQPRWISTFGLCDLTQPSLRVGLYLHPAERHPVSTPSSMFRGLVRYCRIPNNRT